MIGQRQYDDDDDGERGQRLGVQQGLIISSEDHPPWPGEILYLRQ